MMLRFITIHLTAVTLHYCRKTVIMLEPQVTGLSERLDSDSNVKFMMTKVPRIVLANLNTTTIQTNLRGGSDGMV